MVEYLFFVVCCIYEVLGFCVECILLVYVVVDFLGDDELVVFFGVMLIIVICVV